ncbi:two pore calcium channel protein 2-like, partial [Actinia tenebrosa]|uniref:Two pore calcium channel protein 2-like n=1 Tax=Actinia tenebrosa TaxID=6105 RepID=A0A6P8ILU7_ACTTE
MLNSVESMDVEPVFGSLDREETAVDQATVFLEDAIKYRSIHHKIDKRSLRIYRVYYSRLVRWGLTFVIVIDLGLAFFEKPSSLTISSDPRFCGPRPEAPCGVLEGIEILCLLCFVLDVVIK